jgi:hypothetical protein
MAVLCFGESLVALALRSLRLLSFSRATATAFLCGGSFPEDCPSKVNDWTISKITSFIERDSLLSLERFGMGVLYTLTIRDGKKGFRSVLEIFPEVLHLVERFPQGGHTNRTILSASEKGQAVDKAAELIGMSP